MRIGLVLAMLLAVAPIQARENKLVSLRDVPATAKTAADRAAPGVNWLIAKQDSQGSYFLLGKNADNQFVEFLTDAAGKKYAVRCSIALEAAPAAVTAALKA